MWRRNVSREREPLTGVLHHQLVWTTGQLGSRRLGQQMMLDKARQRERERERESCKKVRGIASHLCWSPSRCLALAPSSWRGFQLCSTSLLPPPPAVSSSRSSHTPHYLQQIVLQLILMCRIVSANCVQIPELLIVGIPHSLAAAFSR